MVSGFRPMRYKKIRPLKSKCPRCGRYAPLTEHHKDGNHYNNKPWNIIRVCRICHDHLHGIHAKNRTLKT